VTVRYGADQVEVEVSDDGTREAGGSGSGKGLAGLRERVGMLGGTVTAGPRESGFSLLATLPLA